MTQNIKAPKYFIKIIDEGNELAENALNNIGLSLSWLDKSKGNALNEVLKELDQIKRNKIGYYLQFRNVSYEYAWAKFRTKNVDNKWGQADILDYDTEKKVIKLRTGIVKTVRTIVHKIKNKFK